MPDTSPAPAAAPTCRRPSATSTTRTTPACARSRRPRAPTSASSAPWPLYARVNDYGFIESPYRRVEDGKVTDKIDCLTADEEETHNIAPANDAVRREDRASSWHVDSKGNIYHPERVHRAVRATPTASFGAPAEVPVERRRLHGRLAAPADSPWPPTLIPFLEHDDANRALMGANMQRQAVPLIRPHAPLVGTGMEHRAADGLRRAHRGPARGRRRLGRRPAHRRRLLRRRTAPSAMYLSRSSSAPTSPPASTTVPSSMPARRSRRASRSLTALPCDNSELALGANLTVAYMPWEGFNYEDGIIVSERVVQDDLLTSVNISASRDRRPRHQARPRGNHPRDSEPLRGHARQPRRRRHHPHRRRGRPWRHPGRQGHARRARRPSPPRSACCAPSSVPRPTTSATPPSRCRTAPTAASSTSSASAARLATTSRPESTSSSASSSLRRRKIQQGDKIVRPPRQQGCRLQRPARRGHALHG